MDSLGETEYDPKQCEYTRTELLALLAVDYESLPERTSDPKATPRNKEGLAQVTCACGCPTLFVSKSPHHKYADPSDRDKWKGAVKAAPKTFELIAGMLILVGPALDRYEMREMASLGQEDR